MARLLEVNRGGERQGSARQIKPHVHQDEPDERSQIGPPDEEANLGLAPEADLAKEDGSNDRLHAPAAGEAKRAEVWRPAVGVGELVRREVEVGADGEDELARERAE